MEIAIHWGAAQADKMKDLATEYGYELENRPPLDMEALDDDLENVAGGTYFDVCNAIMEWLGYDPAICD